MRWHRAWLSLVMVIAAAGALTLKVRSTLGTTAQAKDGKVQAADRRLYYEVTETEGPRFRLAGLPRELRLISHLVLPDPAGFEPSQVYTYGVSLEVKADGETLWRRDLYSQSRQSKARAEGAGFGDENTFSLEGLEVTDDRMMVVTLPTGLPVMAELELRLLPDPAAGQASTRGSLALVLVSSVLPLTAAQREALLSSLSPSRRQALSNREAFTPWDRLSRAEQLAHLHREERLAAVGRETIDYRVRPLYFTGFRTELEGVTRGPGFEVSARRAAAINVHGAGSLSFTVQRLGGGNGPLTLTLTSSGDGAQPNPLEARVAEGSGPFVFPLPPGLRTVSFSTESAEGARVVATLTGSARHFGDPASEVRPTEPVPEEVAIEGAIASGTPVVFGLEGPDDLLTRLLRLDLRPIESAGDPALNAEVSIEVLDREGKRLATYPLRLAGVRSHFEQVLRADGSVTAVAEPISARLFAPARGKQVRLTSTRPTFVRAFAASTLAPVAPTVRAPYGERARVESTWRYAPLDERSWLALKPETSAVEPARLSAQVRLERWEPEETPLAESEPTSASVLTPEGRPSRQVGFEKARGEDLARVKSDWSDGAYLTLKPGVTQSARFDGGRARLRYRVEGAASAALGKTVDVRVDGRAFATYRISTSGSDWSLPQLPRGAHRVELRTRARNVSFLLDQPPEGNGEVVRARGMFAMGSEGLRVRLRKPSGEPLTVNVVVYASRPEALPQTALRARIDEGSPDRVVGALFDRLTLADRTLPVPAGDRVVRVEQKTLYARHFALTLGQDISPGSHILRLSGGNAREPLWARFFVLGAPAEQKERVRQWSVDYRAEADDG